MNNNTRPIVGIAWHNKPGESHAAVCQAIEAAGGIPVQLKQVVSYDLDYDDNGMLRDCTDVYGALTLDAARQVRSNTCRSSNAEVVMEGIKAIVFPGGGDMSPSLFNESEPVLTTEGFCAERDVSDHILMSYCLEKDIPVLAICRGMQVLSIVSGASMIQDIQDYMTNRGKHYNYEHRNEPENPGAYRDYTFHNVSVTDKSSILFRLTKTAVIKGVPSWHHQAVKSTENTNLIVTGITKTSDEDLIEAVERPDKTFVLGLQYHPEIAVVRGLDDGSLIYFKEIVKRAGRK